MDDRDLPRLDLEPAADLLARDAENVRRAQRWIEERAGRADERRVLVVLPAGAGAQPMLNGALPALLANVRAAGREADLLLGLNDGIGAPDILASIASERTRVVELWAAPKTSPDDPAQVFASPERTGAPCTLASVGDRGRGTVFVLHQARSPFSAGAVRILLDLYALAVRSAGAGWPLPAITLKCDAESYIVRGNGDDHAPLDLGAPAFGLLADALDEGLGFSFAGSRIRQVAFREVDGSMPLALPDWDEPLPAFHLYNNLVNGTDGFETLQGPAFLGWTARHLAVGYVAMRTCPDGIADDYLMQVLANAAGFRHRVAADCVTINRCPPASDEAALER